VDGGRAAAHRSLVGANDRSGGFPALAPEPNASCAFRLLGLLALGGCRHVLGTCDSLFPHYPSFNHGSCDRLRPLPNAGKYKTSLSQSSSALS
jgi:hypothetical protein